MSDPAAEAREARRRLRGLDLVRPAEVGHMAVAPDGRHQRFIIDHVLGGDTANERQPEGNPLLRARSFAGCGFPGEWA